MFCSREFSVAEYRYSISAFGPVLNALVQIRRSGNKIWPVLFVTSPRRRLWPVVRLARTKKLALKLNFRASGVMTVTGRASAASVVKKTLCLPKFASAPEVVGMIALVRVEGSSTVLPDSKPLVAAFSGKKLLTGAASGGANLNVTFSWPGKRLVTVTETGAWITWPCAATAAQVQSATRMCFFMI